MEKEPVITAAPSTLDLLGEPAAIADSSAVLMLQKRRRGGQPGNSNRVIHGHYRKKRALSEVDLTQIDGRTKVAKELNAFRRELIADLGGGASLSTQKLQIVDMAVRTKLLVDTIDNWLLSQRSLVNNRNRSVYPVVMQRAQLVDSLARQLVLLGLKRPVSKADQALRHLQAKYGQRRDAASATHQG